jgi:dihydrofolate reductase
LKPSLTLIAAVARNRVIGGSNQLLWRIKADLRHFRDHTLGKPLIMGRKTFESIGRPLPGRDTIVVTRDAGFAAAGASVVSSLDEAFARGKALAESRGVSEIMIAGGGEIYAQTIAQADRLLITEVALEPDGDAFFPKIDRQTWRETKRETHAKGPDDDAAYAFVDYRRRDAVPSR